MDTSKYHTIPICMLALHQNADRDYKACAELNELVFLTYEKKKKIELSYQPQVFRVMLHAPAITDTISIKSYKNHPHYSHSLLTAAVPIQRPLQGLLLL